LLRPQQYFAARAGDGIRQRRIVETARRRTEHAVEGVHQDLDGVGRHGIARLLRRVATRKQFIEHARQNRRFATERAAGRLDQVLAGLRLCNVRQRIDVDRADDARIQALEIEHPHVGVQSRHRLQHMTALLGHMHTRIVRAHGGCDDALALQLGQVKEVE